jgi:hypothetical protein
MQSAQSSTRTATITAPVNELSAAGFFITLGIVAARQGIVPSECNPLSVRRMMANAESFNARTLEAVALVAAQQAADRGEPGANLILRAIASGALRPQQG